MKILTKITALLAITAVLIIIVALVIPITPLTVSSLKTTSNKYEAGDTLTYDIDRCKNVSHEVKGTVVRSLVSVDSSLTDITLNITTTGTSDKGCGMVESSLLLPSNIPSGTYKLKITASYDIYWPRPSVVQSFISSNSFYIQEAQ